MTVYFSKKYTTSVNINASTSSNEVFISEAEQYGNAPFDQITIINEDAVKLRINLDGNTDNGLILLPNSLLSGKELRYRFFTISNLDAAVAHTAGKVHVLVENTKFPRRD